MYINSQMFNITISLLKLNTKDFKMIGELVIKFNDANLREEDD